MSVTAYIGSKGYSFYIGDLYLPITTSEVQWSSSNQNKTLNLMDYGEISIIKPRGLSTFSFNFELPMHTYYPFGIFHPGYLPDAKLKYLQDVCNSQKPVRFRIVRFRPGIVGVNYGIMFSTSMMVTIEDWSYTESSNNAGDIMNHITLREYREYSTVSVKNDNASTVTEQPSRDQTDAPIAPVTYTVKKGDCLYNIATKQLGSGFRWREIWNLNKDIVPDPNKLSIGTALTMPN
jgi:LysM repeat protein